jgi:hypothetical protein
MFQPEVLLGVGIVVLFVGLLWGYRQYKTRNRANDPLTEAATKAEYDQPETYEKDERELKRRVLPS